MEINQTFYDKEKNPVLVTLIKDENFRFQSSLMIENITRINVELFENILQTATFVATCGAGEILNRVGMNLSYDGIMTGFDNQEMTYHVSFPGSQFLLKSMELKWKSKTGIFFLFLNCCNFLKRTYTSKKSRIPMKIKQSKLRSKRSFSKVFQKQFSCSSIHPFEP